MPENQVTVLFPRDGVTIDCDHDEFEILRRRIAEGPDPETLIGVSRNGRRVADRGGERDATIWIIGGGVMGLAAAVETSELLQALELPARVCLLEAEAWGGGRDDRTASPKCQAWAHGGALWSVTQPHVTLSILRSRRRLEELAPHSVRHPLALAVQPAAQPDLADYLRPLGVPFEPVTPEVAARWMPAVLCDRVYRVQDGVLDIRLLASALTRRAQALGVEVVRARVERLHRRAGRIAALGLAPGDTRILGPTDQVVLASGARSRALLETAGEGVPGLRVYQSHLIASPVGIPALIYLLDGGLNCVPHILPDGACLNLFGDSRRKELPSDADAGPLQPDPDLIETLRAETESVFDCAIPRTGLISWAACKTELVYAGSRSQAHAALRVGGLNLWLALPGKLTGSFAAAADLAARVVRELVEEPVARPCWEIALPDDVTRTVAVPTAGAKALRGERAA